MLPLLSLFLALVVLGGALGQVMDRGPFYFVLLLIFIVSPVSWHIFGFTEHTSAVFLFVGGIYFLTRYFSKAASPADLFLASLLTGASVFVMPGFVIALTAVTLSCAIVLARERKWRDLALVLLGGLLPVFARALHEQLLYGSIPGLYLALELRQFALSPARILALLVVPQHSVHSSSRCRPGKPQAGCQVGRLFHGGLGAFLRRCGPFISD